MFVELGVFVGDVTGAKMLPDDIVSFMGMSPGTDCTGTLTCLMLIEKGYVTGAKVV